MKTSSKKSAAAKARPRETRGCFVKAKLPPFQQYSAKKTVCFKLPDPHHEPPVHYQKLKVPIPPPGHISLCALLYETKPPLPFGIPSPTKCGRFFVPRGPCQVIPDAEEKKEVAEKAEVVEAAVEAAVEAESVKNGEAALTLLSLSC